MKKLYEKAQQSDLAAAICTIVEVKGSAPRKVGAKMLVFANGKIEGTIGGGNLEKKIIENALLQIEKKQPRLFSHNLLQDHKMCCGGTTKVFIEPILKMPKLYIFGAGHVGKALAKIMRQLDFEIFIIDDRKDYLDELIEGEIQKINAHYEAVLPTLNFDEQTFVVIVTYEHAFDRAILSYCINKKTAYLGMIGSKRKITLTKKMFLENQLATLEALEKVDMPMGLPIHAEGPHEVAISIASKLIQVSNKMKYGH